MAKKGKSNEVVLDFTEVKEGGGKRPRLPEGDYPVKVTKVEKKQAQSGNTMLVFDLTISEGPGKGKMIRDRCTLVESAMWRLYNLMTAAGLKVSKKKMNVPMGKFEGLEFAVTLEDEEYEGKMYSSVAEFLSLEDYEAANDEDEPKKGKKKDKKKGKKKKDEDEDLEALDTDEL